MAKVFTIAPGLDNMGAMKTGGQGSVYKGRRIGEIITAIKLLPTPIYNESADDKNYRDFQNEVNKLKKVNEEPNPNVVKILSSGLSETGNFPFIEMEYIEGPDLEELLQPPHDKIFEIKEVIRLAEHLSNAIAHCHKKDIKHGDIKSNNVKYNVHTGNYMLLDFGLAIMSDEQRRTSLRQAGAVEFMAPEQNEGQMLCETDVYSFGVIIFEMLAGRVPFPLESKSETARNNVRLAHLETLPPDVMELRREALPGHWSDEKKAREMNVPEWLIEMIYKCLKKKSSNRFAEGIELHDFIIHHGIHTKPSPVVVSKPAAPIIAEDNSQVTEQIKQYRAKVEKQERELDMLRSQLQSKEAEVVQLQQVPVTVKGGVSKTAFAVLLLLTIAFAALSAYLYTNVKKVYSATEQTDVNNADLSEVDTTTSATNQTQDNTAAEDTRKAEALLRKHIADSIKQAELDQATEEQPQTTQPETKPATDNAAENADAGSNTPATNAGTVKTPVQYMVVNKAYFYNGPDESTRRNSFIIPSNNAIISSSDEQNNFVYVSFTNSAGQVTKGWIRKKDLQQVSE